MVNVKVCGHLTILLLSFGFMMVKCSLEPTDQFIDKNTNTKQDALIFHKRPSFFVGSRYGRSTSGPSVFATSKTRRLNVVPRNDRFFLSSRYGKRAGMDFLQKNTNNNNQNTNDNSLLAPLLSTPYEQALISEISTGTQLSSKPIPEQQQQQQQQHRQQLQQFNDDFNTNRMLPQQTSSTSLSSSLPPYAYMSCIHTGLQNYYRCNSIDLMFNLKNSLLNDNDDASEVLSTDNAGVALPKNYHDDEDNDDDDVDDTEDDNDVEGNDEK